MRAWFYCTGAELITEAPANVVGRLALAQQARGYAGTADQHDAWTRQVLALREAVLTASGESWTIALEYELLRLEKRVDAVVLTDRAIVCLEFKTGEPDRAMLAEAEDYALDLRDFHAESRRHVIVPLLVAAQVPFKPPLQPWLLPPCPTEPLVCGHAELAAAFLWIEREVPAAPEPLDGAAWLAAPYRPVPTIIEAATMLYARNGVAEIAAARADAANLNLTAAAIRRRVEAARDSGAKLLIVVTGIPGAGKTLCGLNAVFGQPDSAFLTGNLPLIEVLRAALAEDSIGRRECSPKEARRRAKAKLQSVHQFLRDLARATPPHAPPERLIVFDEAQRAWNEAKARQGPRRFGTAPVEDEGGGLTMSEPAHTLEIMGRHPGWAVVVALIGNGQEINTGEAGLREWGNCVAASGGAWRAVAAPCAVGADPVQCIASDWMPWLDRDDALDLNVPIRSVRDTAGAGWVTALLRNSVKEARAIADCKPDLPFLLTRDLGAMRAALRALARGKRRTGIVAAAGAKRLRAEGLGVQADDVADWFLKRWPDVRASDALETFATEYDCQGLELDVVGLAWDGDLIRHHGSWHPRSLSGSDWDDVHSVERRRYILNKYRVLLTRARYETVIWVPRGSDPADPWFDPTRDSRDYDAIADFLLACGARPLAALAQPARDEAAPALL